MYAKSILADLSIIVEDVIYGIDDYALVRYSDESSENLRKIKIEEIDEKPGFWLNGEFEFLEDFMRVD